MNQISAETALQKLLQGNAASLTSPRMTISPEARKRAQEGQSPYAIIVTCSDSRVIPEVIFSADMGEIFVIRVAGNVIDRHQLGSIAYAVEHLGTKLIMVLGHTHCGAVHAAIHSHADGYIQSITDSIRNAIGDEQDEEKACRLNVRHSCDTIRNCFPGKDIQTEGAIYHIDTGKVELLDTKM